VAAPTVSDTGKGWLPQILKPLKFFKKHRSRSASPAIYEQVVFTPPQINETGGDEQQLWPSASGKVDVYVFSMQVSSIRKNR
jgi:hypothetical protein